MHRGVLLLLLLPLVRAELRALSSVNTLVGFGSLAVPPLAYSHAIDGVDAGVTGVLFSFEPTGTIKTGIQTLSVQVEVVLAVRCALQFALTVQPAFQDVNSGSDFCNPWIDLPPTPPICACTALYSANYSNHLLYTPFNVTFDIACDLQDAGWNTHGRNITFASISSISYDPPESGVAGLFMVTAVARATTDMVPLPAEFLSTGTIVPVETVYLVDEYLIQPFLYANALLRVDMTAILLAKLPAIPAVPVGTVSFQIAVNMTLQLNGNYTIAFGVALETGTLDVASFCPPVGTADCPASTCADTLVRDFQHYGYQVRDVFTFTCDFDALGWNDVRQTRRFIYVYMQSADPAGLIVMFPGVQVMDDQILTRFEDASTTSLPTTTASPVFPTGGSVVIPSGVYLANASLIWPYAYPEALLRSDNGRYIVVWLPATPLMPVGESTVYVAANITQYMSLGYNVTVGVVHGSATLERGLFCQPIGPAPCLSSCRATTAITDGLSYGALRRLVVSFDCNLQHVNWNGPGASARFVYLHLSGAESSDMSSVYNGLQVTDSALLVHVEEYVETTVITTSPTSLAPTTEINTATTTTSRTSSTTSRSPTTMSADESTASQSPTTAPTDEPTSTVQAEAPTAARSHRLSIQVGVSVAVVMVAVGVGAAVFGWWARQPVFHYSKLRN